MLLTLIVSGMVWAQELPYKDTDFGCTDKTVAQKYVNDYRINTSSFGGLELCDSKVDTKKLLNDLEILEKGQFNTFGENVYIRGFIPANGYYSWMKSQTRGVKRGNDIPTATAYNSGGYFTMQDGWALLSTLGRVGTIVHEARHTAGYRHVPCTQGPYQGDSMAGCDTTYQYAGSHAIEMEYYARVSVLGKNFHPVYKAMARLMGIARSNFVFNQPVISKKEAVLALAQNNTHADLILDDQVIEREVPQKEGMLKRTSFGGAIFNGRDAFAIELYGNERLNTSIEDTYSYYKLLDRSVGPVFDFEEFDVAPRRYSIQMKDNHSLQFFAYGQGDWARSVNLNFQAQRSATRLENGQDGFFLIDSQGVIYPVNVQTSNVNRPLDTRWNPTHVDFATYNGKTLVLKTDGVIYEKQADGSEVVWSLGRNKYSAMINTPIYDGYVVEH
jgi:hypothetical protein